MSCGHTFGSACIAAWLRENNSCPLCRETFFPGQPRPYLEDGILDVDRPNAFRASTGPGLLLETLDRLLSIFIRESTGSLGRVTASILSRMRGLRDENSRPALQNRNLPIMVAVSFYMASHLLRQPRSPEESLLGELRLSADRIRSIYTSIYPLRAQFLDSGILGLIAGNRLDGMLAFLPPPDGANASIGDKELRRESGRQKHSSGNVNDEVYGLCHSFSTNVGGPTAEYIAKKICKKGLVERRLGLTFPPLKAAIGLYMAAHLLGVQVSAQRIANMLSISEGTLKTGYARVYPVRHKLLEPGMLRAIGHANMPRALEAMPRLDWPPL